ncbi:MAG: LysM peptidoglycan-binding domain-containing protein [Prevotella sp.]|nr:LysM peptidoglycan-binding domain-containing protein [Prevotella sp.]
MKTKNVLFLLAATLVLTTSSCSSRLTDFTVISTKNVPIGNQTTDLKKATVRVEGVDKAHWILCIPLGTPNLKEAIDRAIEKYPGAVALADGVVKSKFIDFLLYGQSSYIVEGTPLYPADMQQNTYNSQVSPTSNSNDNGETYMRIKHQVNGEKNVTELAKMYEVSVADIMKWNNLTSPSLTSGQEIIIYLKR